MMQEKRLSDVRPMSMEAAQLPLGLLESMARKALFSRLAKIQDGQLTIAEGETLYDFGRPALDGLRATIFVNDARFYTEVASGGSIGAGESYMRGDWLADDVTAVVRLMARNLNLVDAMEGGWAGVRTALHKLLHVLNRNTRQGSRENIAAHYDLGNEFFSLFLDPTLMYSCAFFERPDASLHQASIAKLDKICRALDLNARDHVIEIGTGWGGFALHAAQHYGCRVTTTTISSEQYALARERVQAAGLEDRVTVLLQDYRDLTGQYDKLVSIEMIEAVGHDYYGTFFNKCSSLLKPNGAMLLQSITIADQRYEMAKRSVDFIQRYIFPGGCLPSVAVITAHVARHTDMRLVQHDDIGYHYALTLRQWRARFMARIAEARSQGYAEEFLRMWEFYFCYCEGGFLERTTSTVHMTFHKPNRAADTPQLNVIKVDPRDNANTIAA